MRRAVITLALLTSQSAWADCIYTGAKRAYIECIASEAYNAAAGLASLASDFLGLSSTVQQTQSDLEATADEVATLSGDLEATADEVATLSGDLATTSSQADATAADVAALSTALDAATTDLNAAITNVANTTDTRLDLVEGDLAVIEGSYLTAANVGTTAGTIAAGDDLRFGQWSGGSNGLDAAAGRASLGLGSAATDSANAFASAAQGVKADAALPATGGTVSGALTVNGLLSTPGGVACEDGFAHIAGHLGTCIQIDPGTDAGCFNDECVSAGMRACSCFEIAQAWVNGRVNPTTEADVGGAGEYCMSGIGHCQGHGPECESGSAPEIGKIWPHLPIQNPTWPNPSYAGYVATEVSGVCDQSKPTPHSGYPYGSYRCCY